MSIDEVTFDLILREDTYGPSRIVQNKENRSDESLEPDGVLRAEEDNNGDDLKSQDCENRELQEVGTREKPILEKVGIGKSEVVISEKFTSNLGPFSLFYAEILKVAESKINLRHQKGAENVDTGTASSLGSSSFGSFVSN